MPFTDDYISLSQLVNEIKGVIDDTFGDVTYLVIAEISDMHNYPDRKYCFCTLVEKNDDGICKMDAAIWQWSYNIIREFELLTNVKFDKNLKLLFELSVSFHKQYGLRLNITGIDASFTLGQIEKERQETLDKLLKENPETIKLIEGEWATLNKGLDLPCVMQHIALITAPGSDGERDFRHELENNPFHYKFNITPYLTQIQGQDADRMVINKLNEIEQCEKKPDVVVIVRGGGSQLDFSSFDTYNIAKTIAEFKIPIITGIGHERNVSISDLMSHTSVKTPTKAASFITELNNDFEVQLDQMKNIIFDYADSFIQEQKNELHETINDFNLKTAYFLEKQHHEIEKKAIAVKHLNPVNILSRGFAIISSGDKIIINPDQLSLGQAMSVRLKNSSIISTITEIKKDEK